MDIDKTLCPTITAQYLFSSNESESNEKQKKINETKNWIFEMIK